MQATENAPSQAAAARKIIQWYTRQKWKRFQRFLPDMLADIQGLMAEDTDMDYADWYKAYYSLQDTKQFLKLARDFIDDPWSISRETHLPLFGFRRLSYLHSDRKKCITEYFHLENLDEIEWLALDTDGSDNSILMDVENLITKLEHIDKSRSDPHVGQKNWGEGYKFISKVYAWVRIKAMKLSRTRDIYFPSQDKICPFCLFEYENVDFACTWYGEIIVPRATGHEACLEKKYDLVNDELDLPKVLCKFGDPTTREGTKAAIKELVIAAQDSKAQELLGSSLDLSESNLKRTYLGGQKDELYCIADARLMSSFDLVDGVYMHMSYSNSSKEKFEKDMEENPKLKKFVEKHLHEKVKNGEQSAITMFCDSELFNA